MEDKTDGSTTLRLHDKVYLAGLKDVLTKMAIDMEHFEKRIVNLEELTTPSAIRTVAQS